ncbi:hypothetical protein [Leifsonia sp. Leaf264]|uniref:hypothetical protein n=1 Tax=Leifsonia sp. Leaf264 TaxID=1736314 RepID=UPI0006F32899|nr:hypothetical protein [Leifsonia sp. Leaf264]KQO98830.1 hypothetical protein ASF30_12265 [Leifsonia sp. Leaf264]
MPSKTRKLFGRSLAEFEAARDRDPITMQFKKVVGHPADAYLEFTDEDHDYTRPFADFDEYPIYVPDAAEYARLDALANPHLELGEITEAAQFELGRRNTYKSAPALAAIASHPSADCGLLHAITQHTGLAHLPVRNAAAVHPEASVETLTRFYQEAVSNFYAHREGVAAGIDEAKVSFSRVAEHIGLVSNVLAARGVADIDGRPWADVAHVHDLAASVADLYDY